MKKSFRILAAVMAFCMILAFSAMAASEADAVTEAFSQTVSYTDTTYGYGTLDLLVTGEASADGTITIQSVTWDGYDVISYMTDGIYDELCALLTEAGVVPAAAAAVVTESFSEDITYNDTVYGYGALDLTVVGEASSNGTITIEDAYWSGESVISYMTDAIYADLCALLTEAGVVPAAASAEPAEPQAFSETVSYTDTTYGYGTLDLLVGGEVAADGTITIQSVSWDGYDVISYMTDSINAELCELLAAAGVA